MRVISWNVNGLRACHKKGFVDWFRQCDADIVGLQEVRAKPEQLPEELRSPAGWHCHIVSAQRPGYSGVALYSKTPPLDMSTTLGVERFDAEGRLQIAEFADYVIVNCYFPNGKGKLRDNSRVPFKLDFYRALFERLRELPANKPILVMGDFNTAHHAIDLARPKQNRKVSGFMPEECDEFSRWVDAGWTDCFRHFYPELEGQYSWWSQRSGARERNVGWRIDYVLGNAAAMQNMTSAAIHTEVMGSDHCPVSIDWALR